MKLYLAGPMSGIPDFNYPEFYKWKGLLQRSGYRVRSPADMNMEHEKYSWTECMKEAIKMMLDCDGVALLDGWMSSRGTKIEVSLAESIGIPCHTVHAWINEKRSQNR